MPQAVIFISLQQFPAPGDRGQMSQGVIEVSVAIRSTDEPPVRGVGTSGRLIQGRVGAGRESVRSRGSTGPVPIAVIEVFPYRVSIHPDGGQPAVPVVSIFTGMAASGLSAFPFHTDWVPQGVIAVGELFQNLGSPCVCDQGGKSCPVVNIPGADAVSPEAFRQPSVSVIPVAELEVSAGKGRKPAGAVVAVGGCQSVRVFQLRLHFHRSEATIVLLQFLFLLHLF